MWLLVLLLVLSMTEDQMREYVVNGGVLFTVKSISSYRDGGTKVIVTNQGNYYVHKDNHTLHLDYPASDSNRIPDVLLSGYIMDRVGAYIKKSQEDTLRHIKMLDSIQISNNLDNIPS